MSELNSTAMGKTTEQRKQMKRLKVERRNIRRSICKIGTPTTSRGRRNMVRLERYLLRANEQINAVFVTTASTKERNMLKRRIAAEKPRKEDDIFSALERALGILSVEPADASRSPPTFSQLPERIVLRIMKHCDTFSDVLSLASTCSKTYCTWHSFAPFITEKIMPRVVGSISDAQDLLRLAGACGGKPVKYRTNGVKKAFGLKKTGSKAVIKGTERLLINHRLLNRTCEVLQHLIKRDVYESPRACLLGLDMKTSSPSEMIRVRRTVYNLHILMAYLQEPWPKHGLHEFHLNAAKRMILCMLEVCRFFMKHCGKDERRRFGVPGDFISTEGLGKVDSWLSGAVQMMGADRPVAHDEDGPHHKDKQTVDFKYLLDFCGERGLRRGEKEVFDF
jgi:hypothetical protein